MTFGKCQFNDVFSSSVVVSGRFFCQVIEFLVSVDKVSVLMVTTV